MHSNRVSRIGLLLAGLVWLLCGVPAFAEDDCAGPFYANPLCSGKCPVEDCQDVSFAQDATQYQCCPPVVAEVPELPEGMGPITLVLIFLAFSGALWWWRRHRGHGLHI